MPTLRGSDRGDARRLSGSAGEAGGRVRTRWRPPPIGSASVRRPIGGGPGSTAPLEHRVVVPASGEEVGEEVEDLVLVQGIEQAFWHHGDGRGLDLLDLVLVDAGEVAGVEHVSHDLD